VFSRFGAPTKILINEGTKFCGGVPRVVWKGIDWSLHNFTRPSKANMLTEWMVQTMKWGLQKYGV
jgi:hypothetical protein